MRICRFLLVLTLAAGAALTACAYSESEWKVRPWEIIRGLQPQGKTLWRMDRDALEGWTVSRADAKLSSADLTKLWGESVAKLSYAKGGTLTVTPKEPITVAEPADGLELWLYGPLQSRRQGPVPEMSFRCSDASGRKFNLKTAGGGSRWAAKRWWGVAAGLFPDKVEFPVKIHSFTFSKLIVSGKEDFLCFDMLGAFQLRREPLPDVAKMKLPFPTTPDTILPSSMAKGGANSVRHEGGTWSFRYEGPDARIDYRYTPKTGTLSDITVAYNDLAPFRLAQEGGIHAAVNGVKMTPTSADLSATLVSAECKDNALDTLWRWTRSGQSVTFHLRFSVKGKTLIVEASSDEPVVQCFDVGFVRNVRQPQLFALTHLNNRWDYPRLLATPDFLLSVFVDYYDSHASTLVDGNPLGALRRAGLVGTDGARVGGGTIYYPKTDGKLNNLYERVFYTVAPELDDVMPNIPNPPSPYREELSKLVMATRTYELANAGDVDRELAFWRKVHDYGATDIFLHYHSDQFRTPMENNRFSLSLDGARSNGGDDSYIRLIGELRKFLPRVGVYQNNRVIAANDPEFHYSILTRTSTGTFIKGWDGCFRPKGPAMLTIYRKFLPGFLKKYPFNAVYLDELTNAPPWGDVDYDASAPGAGMFSAVLRDYGATALLVKELAQGPVWSEGCAVYFWAGLLDLDYAGSNDTQAKLPLIVDFKLRKINPVETYVGGDWAERKRLGVDRLVAAAIAKGNAGHMLSGFPELFKSGLPSMGRAADFPPEGFGPFLKSYFMIRQLQELYFAAPVTEIRYEVGGVMMSASAMLKAGKSSSGRVYAKYANGLETWVNRGDEGNWTVEVDGEEYVLPPNGHVAHLADQLLQYSVLRDDHRVDYSRGPLYTYCDGRGTMTEFPEMSVSGAFLLRQVKDQTVLTPVPFLAPETVKKLSFGHAVPLKQDGSPAGEAIRLDTIDAGLADLPVDGKAFAYRMEP